MVALASMSCLCLEAECASDKSDEGRKDAFKITDAGKAVAVIVTGERPGEPEAFAAAELQKYVKRISGAELKIVKGGSVPANAILIGTAESNPEIARLAGKLPERPGGLGKEGFEIAVVDGSLIIAGGGSVGALYGTYGLLEKFGCRWYFQDKDWQGRAVSDSGEVMPKLASLSMDTSIKMVERPSFKSREVWQGLGFAHLDWMAKHRLNHLVIRWFDWSEESYVRALPEIRKRGVEIELGHDNSINFWLPPNLYFKSHPEYYALINGERRLVPEPGNKWTVSQFCFSNPDGIKETAKNICEFLDRHPEIKTVGLSYSDARAWATMCQCDECKRLVGKYRPEGSVSYSGAYLHFANQVAGLVAEKRPDAMLSIGAYEDPAVFEAPAGIKAAPNLRLCLYLFQRNGANAIDSSDSRRNCYIRSEISKWEEIFDHHNIVIADYYYGMDTYKGGIWPIYKVIPQDFLYFAKRGFHGASLSPGYKFSNQLSNWLFCIYAWDANANIDAQLDDFCANFFEEASVPMRRYVEALAGMMRDYDQAKIQNIYQNAAGQCGKRDFLPVYPNLLALLDEKRLQVLEGHLGDARRMASKDGAVAKRIDDAAGELARSAAYVRTSVKLKEVDSALAEGRRNDACLKLDEIIEAQRADRNYKNVLDEFQIPDLMAIKNVINSVCDNTENLVRNPSGLLVAQSGELRRSAKSGDITAVDRPEGWSLYHGDGSARWGACGDGRNGGRSVFIEATAPDGKHGVNVALLPSDSDGYASAGAFSVEDDAVNRTYGLSFSAKISEGAAAGLFIFAWDSSGKRQRMIDFQMLKPFKPGTAYSQFFATFALPKDVVRFTPAFHLSSIGRLDVRDVSLSQAKPVVGIYAPDITSVLGFVSLGNMLAKDGSFKMTVMPEDFETQMLKCKCLIIPQLKPKEMLALCDRRESLRRYVEDGGGVFIMRSACGYKPHGWPMDGTIFPEVCEGVAKRAGGRGDDAARTLKVSLRHPVAEGFALGETGLLSYWDHYALVKGSSGEVVMADRDGLPVVIAGRVGKGKVVFAGFTPTDARTEVELSEMEGMERQVVLNAIRWFAQ